MQIHRDIQIHKSLGVLSKYAERNFFFVLEHYKKLFLFGFKSIFWVTVPLKAVKKSSFIPNIWNFLGTVSKYAEWNLPHADNTRNEIHHILIIRRMKFSAHL